MEYISDVVCQISHHRHVHACGLARFCHAYHRRAYTNKKTNTIKRCSEPRQCSVNANTGPINFNNILLQCGPLNLSKTSPGIFPAQCHVESLSPACMYQYQRWYIWQLTSNVQAARVACVSLITMRCSLCVGHSARTTYALCVGALHCQGPVLTFSDGPASAPSTVTAGWLLSR